MYILNAVLALTAFLLACAAADAGDVAHTVLYCFIMWSFKENMKEWKQ
jgi:hypothetical protein